MAIVTIKASKATPSKALDYITDKGKAVFGSCLPLDRLGCEDAVCCFHVTASYENPPLSDLLYRAETNQPLMLRRRRSLTMIIQDNFSKEAFP